MFWLPLAATVGMGLLGAQQGKRRAEREADTQRRTANMRAAEQQYAPWTGRQNFTDVQFAKTGEGDAMLSGALGGGMTGYSLGSGADKLFEGMGSSGAAAMGSKPGMLGVDTNLSSGSSMGAPSPAFGGGGAEGMSSWDKMALDDEQKKLAMGPTGGQNYLGGSSLRF